MKTMTMRKKLFYGTMLALGFTFGQVTYMWAQLTAPNVDGLSTNATAILAATTTGTNWVIGAVFVLGGIGLALAIVARVKRNVRASSPS